MTPTNIRADEVMALAIRNVANAPKLQITVKVRDFNRDKWVPVTDLMTRAEVLGVVKIGDDWLGGSYRVFEYSGSRYLVEALI